MNAKALLFAVIVFLGLTTAVAQAVQVQGVYQDNPAQCDSHPTTFFGHELGDAAVFPSDEGLLINIASTNQTFCVPDDGAPNDFLVTITNITPYSWKDLYFVVDAGVTVGNVDGAIEDTTFPGFNGAFKIDNLGLNSNLVSGDTNNNLLFDPGEAWEFGLTNFVAPASLPPFPIFSSVGHFSASSGSDGVSNASILANRVPEPTACTLLLAGSAALTVGRRRKRLS
jgi:hypothetical protein